MRIAVLSDIHSNILALDAVLKDIDKNQQPINAYWCLGDAIGYGLNPVETIYALKNRVDINHWAAGNHEDLYWENISDEILDQKAKLMMKFNRSMIEADPETKEYLSNLPSRTEPVIFDFLDGFQFILSHNGPEGREKKYVPYPYPWCYQVLLPDLVDSVEKLFAKDFPRHTLLDKIKYSRNKKFPTILLTGHTHIPMLAFLNHDKNAVTSLFAREGTFLYETDCQKSEVVLLNPGSVGFPRDECTKASYLIIDTKEESFHFIKVPYLFRQNTFQPALDFFRKKSNPMDYEGIERKIYKLRENLWNAYLPDGQFPPPQEWVKFFKSDEKKG